MVEATVLVVVVTTAADAAAATQWLAPQLTDGQVVTAYGYYAGITAVDRRARAVVIDVGAPSGHDHWRLAELRTRQPDATVVVVADAMLIPPLSAALHADATATSVDRLPPLRELLVTDEPVVRGEQTGQTRARRSRR